jgi:hypothetical protein
VIQKDGKKAYKLKNSKGGKMFITAYNKAIRGDARWADFLVKMGFAGGYEPAKQENTNINLTPQDILKKLDEDTE